MRTRKEWKREMKQQEKCRRRQEKQEFRKPKKRLKKIAICLLLFSVSFFFLRQKLLAGYTQEEHVVENKPTEPVKPKKSATKKKKVNLKKEKVLLAEHTIYNPRSGADRNENMRIAAEIINGLVLGPGEWFSWLEIVGDTTPEKGFLEAPVIYGRKVSSGLGGGVCQVSSAINSAVIAAGLETRAQKHSLPSSYIHTELGDHEATVSFDSKIDFSFVNTLENPIMFHVIAKGGDVTVKVFEIRYQKV